MASFQLIPSSVGMAFLLGLISASSIRIEMTQNTGHKPTCSLPKPPLDSIPLPPNNVIIGEMRGTGPLNEFKYKWLAIDGTVHSDKAPGRLEVAATSAITPKELNVAIFIVSKMIRNMPLVVFNHLASVASVGLFTIKETMTVFPEYRLHRDRPECAGICSGACSDTCTEDGRKYDSLAGYGGRRTTCLDDNFMCTDTDPYHKTYSVLVHEFAHTIHLYGLNVTDYYNRISQAFDNARDKNIWDRNTYAMSNAREYFAEGTGVFFNTNQHCDSCGQMNRCGKSVGYCESETEARNWLRKQDTKLFEALSYTFTNNQPNLPGELVTCVKL